MMRSFGMERDVRNAYLRYILNLLRSKYHINLAGLSKASDFYSMNLNDFCKGVRNFSVKNLDKLEYFLSDLYGGILEDEVPQDEKRFKEFIEMLRDQE